MPPPDEHAASESAPHIDQQDTPGSGCYRVLGPWTAAELTLPPVWDALSAQLNALGASSAGASAVWDLREMAQLDHLGAQVLWDHWGRQWPEKIELQPAQRAVLERVPSSAWTGRCRRRPALGSRF